MIASARVEGMPDLIAAAKSAQKVDQAVGLVAKMIGKLKAQPDIAAQKLGQPLEEIAKTLQVFDSAARCRRCMR